MKSGKAKVSIHVFAVVALAAAAQAGREGEDGTGAMWIAPELVELVDLATPREVDYCRLPARGLPVELRFERLRPEDIDSEAPQLTAEVINDRQVDFDWHPATSELRYRSPSGAPVFGDLALPMESAPQAADCGPTH